MKEIIEGVWNAPAEQVAEVGGNILNDIFIFLAIIAVIKIILIIWFFIQWKRF